MSSKVIVLYLRLPYDEKVNNGKVELCPTSNPNGIIPSLKNVCSVFRNATWIAASEYADNSSVPVREKIELFDWEGECILRRVKLNKDEINRFYYKTSKEGLWPIIHSFPEKYNFESIDWENFVAMNQRFAEAACEEATTDSLIWIHGYQLWLVPYYIRKIRPESKVAFCFHTPFPSPDIFNILHWRSQIIESLLNCDLISFDIPRYSENFVNTVKSLFPVKLKKKEKVKKHFGAIGEALSEPYMTRQLVYKGNLVRLDIFPEGTNFEYIQKILSKDSTLENINRFKERKKNCQLIFAPSRTDYIKGTKELLLCYERLLKRKEPLRGNIMLFLVAIQPRDGIVAYNNIQHEIEEIVSRIIRDFGSSVWEPVVYSKNSLSFEEMVAWYYVSNVLWVASLRDGMNIISKEFIATKRGSDGALILSEFAGAAVELGDAILTNPYSNESMDRAIDLALSLPKNELKRRIEKMFRKTLVSDINAWVKQLDLLREGHGETPQRSDIGITIQTEI